MMTRLFSALLCEVTFRGLTATVFRGKTIETVFGHLTVAINDETTLLQRFL